MNYGVSPTDSTQLVSYVELKINGLVVWGAAKTSTIHEATECRTFTMLICSEWFPSLSFPHTPFCCYIRDLWHLPSRVGKHLGDPFLWNNRSPSELWLAGFWTLLLLLLASCIWIYRLVWLCVFVCVFLKKYQQVKLTAIIRYPQLTARGAGTAVTPIDFNSGECEDCSVVLVRLKNYYLYIHLLFLLYFPTRVAVAIRFRNGPLFSQD